MILNRREFAQSCALATGLTQTQVNKVLDYFIEDAKSKLTEGNEVTIPNIGRIIPVERKINGHSNPITNQYHESNIYKTIRIKVSPSFKKELNAY